MIAFAVLLLTVFHPGYCFPRLGATIGRSKYSEKREESASSEEGRAWKDGIIFFFRCKSWMHTGVWFSRIELDGGLSIGAQFELRVECLSAEKVYRLFRYMWWMRWHDK